VQKSNLTSGDVKGAVAGLDFILHSGCKYNVSDETLSLELNQLGLPKEHCEALAKVYQANKEAMQARLRCADAAAHASRLVASGRVACRLCFGF
jgi:hypothetical protein